MMNDTKAAYVPGHISGHFFETLSSNRVRGLLADSTSTVMGTLRYSWLSAASMYLAGLFSTSYRQQIRQICPAFRRRYSFTVQLQSAGGTCASRKSATRL